MAWAVSLHSECEAEFHELADEVQDELLARLRVLAEFGPGLGRPNVDTLNGSTFSNMKELRFRMNGLWRFAFAFDPKQCAIVRVGGNKEGKRQGAFYKSLIRMADARFAEHIARMNIQVKR